MSSVREKIEKGIEALECLDQTFTEIAAEERGFRSGAEYGYRLAIEELRERAKEYEAKTPGQVNATAILLEHEAASLAARLEGRRRSFSLPEEKNPMAPAPALLSEERSDAAQEMAREWV